MLLQRQLGRKDGGMFVGAHNKCPNGGTFGRCAANRVRGAGGDAHRLMGIPRPHMSDTNALKVL